MKKALKLIFVTLSIIILILLISGCKQAPKYNCQTCQDNGIIDCPECDIAWCMWCEYGSIYKNCPNCNGQKTIGRETCPNCHGKVYNENGYKINCKKCYGLGWVGQDCPACTNGTVFDRKCDICNGGIVRAEGGPCQNNCSAPKSGKSNKLWTNYIDCPDCDQ